MRLFLVTITTRKAYAYGHFDANQTLNRKSKRNFESFQHVVLFVSLREIFKGVASSPSRERNKNGMLELVKAQYLFNLDTFVCYEHCTDRCMFCLVCINIM